MKISAKKILEPGSQSTACAVVTVSGKTLSGTAKALDDAMGGLLGAAVKRGDLNAELASTVMVQCPANMKSQRVLLVSRGKGRSLSSRDIRKVLKAALKALTGCNCKDAIFYVSDLVENSQDAQTMYQALGTAAATTIYRYSETLSKKVSKPVLARVTVDVGASSTARSSQAALDRGLAIGNGTNAARELGNLPANYCTPTDLAKEAKRMARGSDKMTCKILDEKQMTSLGMGSLLSVTEGSTEPAKLIIMDYRGTGQKSKPIVLVGKGITFDTGGISLKPGGKMDEMKFDMCGAASVFGTMTALLELDLPINVVAIVAAAENMPAGNATKPGDVVTSMSGQTIEVLNTDAEGRLVLCDALTYAERYQPRAVVDIATLTGACVVALGKPAAALYSNNDKLAEQLLSAGEKTQDRAWRMPLWDEYQSQLKSNFADIANIGGPEAGSVTAACFLSRFTRKYHWAHLDIAGAAWMGGEAKGATGRPVGLLSQYLLDQAGQ
jgi:leucyl aminopeptidase